MATRTRSWSRSKKKQERLRYEGRQSKTTKLVNMFEILGEEFYSAIKAASKVHRVS